MAEREIVRREDGSLVRPQELSELHHDRFAVEFVKGSVSVITANAIGFALLIASTFAPERQQAVFWVGAVCAFVFSSYSIWKAQVTARTREWDAYEARERELQSELSRIAAKADADLLSASARQESNLAAERRSHDRSLSELQGRIQGMEVELQSERDQSQPDFSGSVGIGHVLVMDAPDGPVNFTAAVVIANRGADSITANWRVTGLVRGAEIPVYVSVLPLEPLGWEVGQGPDLPARLISNKDTIIEKTANRPIVRGGREAGWIVISFPEATEDDVWDAALTITYEDMMGNEYYIQTPPPRGHETEKYFHVPGLYDQRT